MLQIDLGRYNKSWSWVTKHPWGYCRHALSVGGDGGHVVEDVDEDEEEGDQQRHPPGHNLGRDQKTHPGGYHEQSRG